MDILCYPYKRDGFTDENLQSLIKCAPLDENFQLTYLIAKERELLIRISGKDSLLDGCNILKKIYPSCVMNYIEDDDATCIYTNKYIFTNYSTCLGFYFTYICLIYHSI